MINEVLDFLNMIPPTPKQPENTDSMEFWFSETVTSCVPLTQCEMAALYVPQPPPPNLDNMKLVSRHQRRADCIPLV